MELGFRTRKGGTLGRVVAVPRREVVGLSHLWEVKVAGLGDGRPTAVKGRDMPGTAPGCRGGLADGAGVPRWGRTSPDSGRD